MLHLYWSIVMIAFRTIVANKVRSLLTMLGIIIGVCSVTSVMSIGEGARGAILTDVKDWGTNRLSLRPGSRGQRGVATDSVQSITLPDALAILDRVPLVDVMAPEVRASALAKAGNRNTRTSITGTSNTYFEIFNFKIAKGRVFLDQEERSLRRVCVLGPKLVEKLFGSEKIDVVGKTVRLDGEAYLIVGVTEKRGDQGWYNPDDQAFIPYTTAMRRILGTADLAVVHLHVADENRIDEAEESIREAVRHIRKIPPGKPDDFYLNNSAEFLRDLEKFTMVFKMLLTGIASISLGVGGIGIMNIMLVTVAERTREIGVRKALGAKDRSILFQFLIEAIVICAIGGVIGILSGSAIVAVFNWATKDIEDMFRASISEVGVLLGLGVSVGTAICFGLFPAIKASRLDPIEALRYE